MPAWADVSLFLTSRRLMPTIPDKKRAVLNVGGQKDGPHARRDLGEDQADSITIF
ncbi:hypothetical protein [Parasphingorhabdus sp.]|uniref:hypothetical protein n=1 Tax=Parasphingorhabdus sp. TaxID=2709688 RepID=UPI0032634BC4